MHAFKLFVENASNQTASNRCNRFMLGGFVSICFLGLSSGGFLVKSLCVLLMLEVLLKEDSLVCCHYFSLLAVVYFVPY